MNELQKLINHSQENLPWMIGFASDGEKVERTLHETDERAS